MHKVHVPYLSGAPLRQLEELAAWSEQLTSGMLVAFTSHASERRLWPMEGCYWLARTLGPAFAVPASQVHASDYFEEGWLVVKCQWYKVITTSPRCYKLLAGEKLLVVSEMIRMKNVKFEKTVGRESRSSIAVSYMSEDTHNALEACARAQCDDDDASV